MYTCKQMYLISIFTNPFFYSLVCVHGFETNPGAKYCKRYLLSIKCIGRRNIFVHFYYCLLRKTHQFLTKSPQPHAAADVPIQVQFFICQDRTPESKIPDHSSYISGCKSDLLTPSSYYLPN